MAAVRAAARDSSIGHFIWFQLAVPVATILRAGIRTPDPSPFFCSHFYNGLVEALKENIRADVVHDVRSNRNFSSRFVKKGISQGGFTASKLSTS